MEQWIDAFGIQHSDTPSLHFDYVCSLSERLLLQAVELGRVVVRDFAPNSLGHGCELIF